MIKVLSPGFYSTIQDFGRVGYQQYGVPYSGVMDQYSASMANALLGNGKNAALIEITMTGPTLQFDCDTFICISGANMTPKLNENDIQLQKIVNITTGDVLSFGKLHSGFRCYLAVSGGFNTEKVMHSQSMYKGITKQFALSKNDLLKIADTSKIMNQKHASIRINESHFNLETIDVFKGPEFNQLTRSQQIQLGTQKFTISKDNNRMAYQLEQPLENNLEAILTSLVLPGTVQLTPDGRLIVLMRDCQTTGGYPRVLQLKESAINVLAQKFTGNAICFNFLD